ARALGSCWRLPKRPRRRSSFVRVSPPRVFSGVAHAPRPPAEAGGAADAHRQARFVLGEELDLVLSILEAEAGIAQDASGSKYRNQLVAVALATWSRAWASRLEALHAVETGNYLTTL